MGKGAIVKTNPWPEGAPCENEPNDPDRGRCENEANRMHVRETNPRTNVGKTNPRG